MDWAAAGLTTQAFMLAIAVTFFAGFVKGAIGFAMPMIMISAFSSFLPPETALAGLILPTLVSNLSQAFRQGWHPAWQTAKTYRRMLVATMVFIVISAQFVRIIPQDLFLFILGLPIAAFAALQLSGRRLALHLDHRNRAEWVLGAIGGLYGGWFTPTEAAVVAAVVALLVSVFIYRGMKFPDLPKLLLQAAKTSSSIMLIVAASMVSAWLITIADIPAQVTAMMGPFMDNKLMLMVVLMVLVYAVGTALDLAPTVLILTPVIMPLVKQAGIDPYYFGIMFMMNNAIGLITPPVGTVLNVVSSIARVNLDTVIKGMFPFLIAETLVMFLLVLFPQLVTVPARWFY